MTETTESTTLKLPAALIELQPIELQPGERYAGLVLDADGHIAHHLILLPAKPAKRLTWSDAMAWAESVGGQLPTRQEQALLFANCKQHIEVDWYWSSEESERGSSAWLCGFGDGRQINGHKSFEVSAVAVRLIPLTS